MVDAGFISTTVFVILVRSSYSALGPLNTKPKPYTLNPQTLNS